MDYKTSSIDCILKVVVRVLMSQQQINEKSLNLRVHTSNRRPIMTSTTYSTVFGHAMKSIKVAFYFKKCIYLFSRCLAKVYKYFYITDVINLLLQKNKKCFSSYAKAQAGWGEKRIV